MNFFKELKENYKKEFVDEPKNRIRWEVLHGVNHYRFLVDFLDGVRPVELTIEELIDLYYSLKKYKNSFPKPEVIVDPDTYPRYYKLHWAQKSKTLFKEYPYLFVGNVMDSLAGVIRITYEEYAYLSLDEEIIKKSEARPCKGEDCIDSEVPSYLNSTEETLCSFCDPSSSNYLS